MHLLKLWMSGIMTLIVACTLVINVVWPDRAVSELENRGLAGFPAFNLSSILSGKTSADLESWFADQFTGRDFLLHLNYCIKKLCGNGEIQDVYLGKGQLLQNPSAPDEELLKSQMESIEAFSKHYNIPAYVLVAPTAAAVQKSRLPMFADVVNEQQVISNMYSMLDNDLVKGVDAASALNERAGDYIFYKSDHHWTSLGAYLGFAQLMKAKGDEPPALEDFRQLLVSNNFKGTLAGKTGSVLIQDDISIYTKDDLPDYVVSYSDSQKKSTSIYDAAALDQRNQYEVFLGGNESLINIEVDNDSDRHLLLFKDSYANSMIQFLLPYYRTITIVDPRYFYDDIDRVIKNNMIDEIAYVYNYDTFNTDTGLNSVLELDAQ
ncbi:MAG: hypothetical protein HUJ54_09390 [Erysipelotrichaceae bacterium]|nr:hypothetical protein [Erysipelotrichaceae bacterium]